MDNKQYSDLLFNQTKDLIWIVDHHLNLVYANEAYLNLMKEVTGVEKMLNSPVLVEGFGDSYIEKWKSYYQKAISGESFTIEEHFFHPNNNQTQYGHISFSPIKDDDGNVISVACRNTDVTETVQEKYRASSLMDASLDVFCAIDEAGYFTYVSEAATKHWGYTPSELINTPFIELVLKEDVSKTKNIADAIIAGEEVKSFTNRYKRKDGGVAYNLWSARWDIEVKLMYCVARDAKDKIEEERQLKLLSSVITNTNDAVLITEAGPLSEPGLRIIYVNEAFTRMTGYTAEEVIGKTPRILQGPKSDKEALAKLGNALRNWQPYEITTVNYKKNGEEFWINFTVTPVADETGWYTHWIAIERDVTAQKNAELEQILLAKITDCFREKDLSHASKILCEVIRDFADFELVELWCPNMERTEMSRIAYVTTLQAFLLENDSLSQLPITEGLPGKIWGQMKQILWNHTEIAENFARKVEAQNEGLKHILGVPIIHNKEINGVLVIGTRKDREELEKLSDIIHNLEKVIGSEINRKSLEDDLKHLYEAIPEILCITNLEGRNLKMNPAGFELLGYTEDEILFKHLDMFVHPDDKNTSFQELEKLKKGISLYQFENRCITKAGNVIWLSWNCNVSLQDGLIYAAAKDITSEKELSLLNKQASNLAKVGSWEYDLVEDNLFWSNEVHHLHETDPNTFVPNVETAIDFYKEEYKSYVADEIHKSLTEGAYLDYEAVIISKSKKEKWVRVIGSPEFIEGKCVKFMGSFQNTTDHREAESRLQSLSDNIPGVVFMYLLHPDGSDEFKYVSKGSEKIWGYSPEEVTENIDLAWNQVKAGGDFEAMKQSICDSTENKSQWYMRFRIVRADGEKRILQGFGTPEFLSNGTVQYNSVVLDITEKAKNEELLEQTSNIARIGTWEVDLINNSLFWSDITHEIHETSKGFKSQLSEVINFYHEDFREIATEAVNNCIETGAPFDFEAILVTNKNNEVWVRAMGRAEILDGKCSRIFGSFQDINQKKVVELRLKSLANNIPGTIFQYQLFSDGTDQLLHLSKGTEKLWGITAEEGMRNNALIWDQISAGGDIDKVQASLGESMTSLTNWHAHFRSQLPSGKIKWLEGLGTPRRLPDGSTIWDSIILDITDLKEREIEIKQANDRFEKVTEATNDAIYDWNIKEDTLYWGGGFNTLFGHDVEKISPTLQSWTEHIHPEDLERVTNSLNKKMESDHTFWTEEYRFKREDGSFAFVIDRGIFIKNSKGESMQMVGSMTDISERKQYFMHIEKQNNKLRKIAWTQSHVVRAPLARILGIINLIEAEKENLDDLMFWLSQLKVSSNEMDEIVKKITEEAQEIQLNISNE